MNRFALLLPLAVAALGLTGLSGAPAAGAAPADRPVVAATGKAIPGHYIVTVQEGTEPRGLTKALGISPRFVYTSAVNGFAAELNAGQLTAVRRSSAVVSVEEDQVVTATRSGPSAKAVQSVTAGGGLWGLDRIDQRSLPLSGSYNYTTAASAVRAYVIDTGIYTAHGNFGGRAHNVYDAFGGNGQDCNGHGTHVAGTIGGATYGVAKGALLRGVRVLDCNGSGSTSGIIRAVDWLRTNHIKPAVANLSLGGGYSSTLNSAVTNLANAGVSVAVAAGNENANACNVSPASASNVLTVAASNKTDTRASFSNYGSCVETYAPGVAVTSTWSNGGTNTISGTSMATPHVAGVMALYKATYGDAASSTVNNWIVNNATTAVIKSNVTGTPNRLLWKGRL